MINDKNLSLKPILESSEGLHLTAYLVHRVEQQCHVANSFHVKPLLRWLQWDREFLLLGADSEALHLYMGNQSSLQKIFTCKTWRTASKNQTAIIELNDWLNRIEEKTKAKLFIAGETALVFEALQEINYKNTITPPIASNFDEHELGKICNTIRQALQREAKRALALALLEFRLAEEFNLTEKNIFDIARSATGGRIKKLIVADGLNLFGKLNKKTGELAIHPFDLDHEDDDILDDLAQTVLADGGEVIVAHRDDIPKGRPALAILRNNTVNVKQALKWNDNEESEERIIL